MIGYLSRSEVITYAPCRSDIRRPASLSSLLDRVQESTVQYGWGYHINSYAIKICR